MKKRFVIPLAIIIGFVFLMVVFYNIGKNIEQKPQATAELQIPQMENTEPETPVVRNQLSNNLLMRTSFIEAPVINSVGKNLGTRAYIEVPQELLLEVVSLEDVAEFYKSFRGKDYNWVSIICPEGTGLVFGGGGGIATYGKIDNIGRMDGDIHWAITYDETTGTFKEL